MMAAAASHTALAHGKRSAASNFECTKNLSSIKYHGMDEERS